MRKGLDVRSTKRLTSNARLNHFFDIDPKLLVWVHSEQQVADVSVNEIPLIAELHVVQQRSLGRQSLQRHAMQLQQCGRVAGVLASCR